MNEPENPNPDEQAPDTERQGPRARRAPSLRPRQAWGHETNAEGKVVAVRVICGGCSREVRLAAPRFQVEPNGQVTARDQGDAFRCTTCDSPIGPLVLADWRFGRMR